jgi:hypothetical protein
MAQRLGAKCQTEFTAETTHVIARVVRHVNMLYMYVD